MGSHLSAGTYEALKLLSDKKNLKPSLIETARHIIGINPKIAVSAEVLSRRVKFRREYYKQYARHFLSSSSLSSLLSSSSSSSSFSEPHVSETDLTDEYLESQTFKDKIALERFFARERNKERENAARIKYLLKQLDIAERRFEALASIKEDVEPIYIEPKKSSSINESVVFTMASDWHVEENVDARTVNNMNEYNLDIASSRISYYFKNLMKMVSKERHDAKIDELVLWLGGDLMTGYIHLELLESNNLSPTETVRWLKRHLIGGIDFLLREGGFKKIYIPTNYGNHGRTTDKIRISTGAKNSYEFMLYCDLEDIYRERREKRIQFLNAMGQFNYMTIYDKVIRMHHGNGFRYRSGVGGLSIPAKQYIKVQNITRRADFDVFGHHHTFYGRDPQFFSNGSLIGLSAYGMNYGGEPPMQGFFVISKKRGIISPNAIFSD